MNLLSSTKLEELILISYKYFAFVLFVIQASTALTQFGSGNSTSNDTITQQIEDSIRLKIEASVRYDLRNCEIALSEINIWGSRFGYNCLVPMKTDEDGTLLIWAVYSYDQRVSWLQTTKSITDVDNIDCTVLGKDICQMIEMVKDGYEDQFGTDLTNVIHLFKSPSEVYFKVIPPDPLGEYVKFNPFGKCTTCD